MCCYHGPNDVASFIGRWQDGSVGNPPNVSFGSALWARQTLFPVRPPLFWVMRQRQEEEGGDGLQSTNSQLLGQARRGKPRKSHFSS